MSGFSANKETFMIYLFDSVTKVSEPGKHRKDGSCMSAHLPVSDGVDMPRQGAIS